MHLGWQVCKNCIASLGHSPGRGGGGGSRKLLWVITAMKDGLKQRRCTTVNHLLYKFDEYLHKGN